MRSVIEKLKAFAENHAMLGKGAICVGLVVTRHAKDRGIPLDAESLVTAAGGQVLGLGKGAVQSILRDHGISRTFAEEGGRTSRGSIGNMRAYVAWINSVAQEGTVDLDALELWWIERVRAFFAGRPLKLRLDHQISLTSTVADLLAQAQKRQSDGSGVQYLGAVLQHLVGAKLELASGKKLDQYGAFVADEVSDRPGDFVIESVVVHVTTAPGESLMEKCRRNLDDGYLPLIVTPHLRVAAAESLAEQAGIARRIDILAAEQFVAANLHELAGFQSAKRRTTAKELVAAYNRMAACENDPSLLIDLA